MSDRSLTHTHNDYKKREQVSIDSFEKIKVQLREIISMTGFACFHLRGKFHKREKKGKEKFFSLYQSILEPWCFFVHIADINSNGNEKLGTFIWIIREGDKEMADFQSFRSYFVHQPMELPLANCKYHGKSINEELALRILYHAFNHPEQYVREMIADELDKLLKKYDGWGEGKKE